MSVKSEDDCSVDGSTDNESIDLINSVFTESMVNSSQPQRSLRRLPIQSFNHIAFDVACIDTSLRFYIELLGFKEVPRPPFEAEGHWLWGHGLALHIVATRAVHEKQQQNRAQREQLSKKFPRVSHFALVSKDMALTKQILDEGDIEYFEDFPLKDRSFHQLFFFDPDANVIEISNCGPDVGHVNCDNQKER